MKVKMLGAVVVSLLLTVSFTSAAPVSSNSQLIADDSINTPTSDATANPGVMDNNSTNPMAAPSDPTNGAASMNGTGDSSPAGSDEESQDQATGDNDY
ncbi:MAG: hypothetical protein K0S27_166 [Gammaproteobacteria bacterium]|jgi:hypothetical protein|nr:hypothetical protein [Gammaproteobacteria bacterium]